MPYKHISELASKEGTVERDQSAQHSEEEEEPESEGEGESEKGPEEERKLEPAHSKVTAGFTPEDNPETHVPPMESERVVQHGA